jgi:hypothetical protein
MREAKLLRKLTNAELVERVADFVSVDVADEYEKVESEMFRRFVNNTGIECYEGACTFPDCECS